MKRSAVLRFAGACFLLAGILSPDEAQAYVDLGTGSFMIQCLVGGFLGLVLSLKVFWGKIKAFFTARTARQRMKSGDERL